MSIFGRSYNWLEQVVITDVTQMQHGHSCIAALHRGNPIRLHEPNPTEDWLKSIGGLVPGDIVSLEWRVAPKYRPPHKEDGEWRRTTFEKNSRLDAGELEQLLTRSAFDSVRKAFGEPIFYSARGAPAFKPGSGKRSLATLNAKSLTVKRFSKGLRAEFTDGERTWSMIPVEDLALRRSYSGERSERTIIEAQTALVRVGLTRPFQMDNTHIGCFLQMNYSSVRAAALVN